MKWVSKCTFDTVKVIYKGEGEMKSKKAFCIILCLSMVFLMCGCRYDYTYDLTDSVNLKVHKAVYYTESELQQLDPQKKDTYIEEVLEDGNTYYKKEDSEVESYENYNKTNSLGVLRSDIVYLPCEKIDETADIKSENSSVPDMYNAVKINMKFILNDEITETNGTIADDKRIVEFEYSGKNADGFLYAYTDSGKRALEADKTAPIIKGLKKNKYYNRVGMQKLRIYDDIGLKSVTCNGYDMTATTISSNGKTAMYWFLKDTKQYKQGKNKIVATDLSGNKSTYTFLYDDTLPTVKKLNSYTNKKKKVVFYVKDKKSGINKITYQKNYSKEKKLSKKYIKKVTKGKYKGYYKVTFKCKTPTTVNFNIYDKAGNINKIYGIYMNRTYY